jgi:hypothetical protein
VAWDEITDWTSALSSFLVFHYRLVVWLFVMCFAARGESHNSITGRIIGPSGCWLWVIASKILSSVIQEVRLSNKPLQLPRVITTHTCFNNLITRWRDWNILATRNIPREIQGWRSSFDQPYIYFDVMISFLPPVKCDTDHALQSQEYSFSLKEFTRKCFETNSCCQTSLSVHLTTLAGSLLETKILTA